ncbi:MULTISPECIES: efflux RND transporter permease subunit [unclassified Leifsonia]|uniref:efflux RND transporter permease subunit n=1 Tax=unclassified Leifsonia TaxID=2663824 RepID=UPI0006F92B0F|nr:MULTISPECIES: efflux RND transporter permease subunit [unclassified Leifsonia]KQX08286.1 hydrogenase expression protein [Leifsonia sp. Root1293]KRA12568.1 hydrogenase expression protein [Leifsonia sp. Root60]
MHFLAVLSMKNRALIALITVVVAIFGGITLTTLKQELAPSIQFPQLAIVASYPGASPEVVNNDVSTPVESAIQGVAGLESTTAVSNTNQSLITAQFTYGTDLATAEQKLTQAINRVKGTLPDGVEPQVFSGSFDDLPIVQLAVTSDDDEKSLAADITKLALPDLEEVDGVNGAQLTGAIGQRVTITPNDAALAAAGLTSQAISDALKQNGVLLPAGSITEDDLTLTVQSGAKLDSVDAIAALPLVPTDPAAFASGIQTVGDVATVAETDDPTTSISRVDGKPALTIAVTKLPSANTVDVSKGVNALIPEIEDKLGSNATITVVFDQAPFIEQSIQSLTEEGLLGLFFAVIVILIFLMSIRSTLVTAISIPTSVLITFIGMQATGYTLNIITLGALTIAIGRVVDDSIVVIENIKRQMVAGVDRAETILRAVKEVAGAITASTITTVAVFLPIAFVGDVTGELFRPFALTITIALLSSLLVSLTIVPVLAYWFLRPPKPRKHEAVELPADEGGSADYDELEHPSRLQKGYLPIIRWTLRHSVATILIAVLVLLGTLALTPLMKTNFLGATGQNTLTVTQTLEPGTSLAAQDAAATVVEKALLDTDGVETVQLTIGSSGSALRDAFTGGAGGITYSITTDPDADATAVQADIEDQLGDITDQGEIAVTASSGFGGGSDILVDVTASSSDDLQKASDEIVSALGDLDSIKAVSSNLSASLPYIAVTVDRDAAAQAGLSEVAIGSIVSQAMQPSTIGSIAIDDSTLTIYLQSENPPTTIAELSALPIPTLAGPVALDTLATVENTEGPASVTTVKGLRSATITATPGTDNLSVANTEVTTALTDTELPQGANAEIGGVTASQGDAFSQLGLALLAAILIVYIVMVATFRSLRQPLLLLVSVPFAATGAIILQIVSGIPLGVASLIGVLMLIGIVVTNAIVLVDLVNQYRRRGMGVEEAVMHGASRRLRPILMTALATIFALLPMAIGLTGHGGFISQPLAIVVIGGLVSSTVLTLVVLPTLYNLVEGARDRRAEKKAAKAGAAEAVPAE